MFLMTSQEELAWVGGTLKTTERRAFFPACHSANVGSGLSVSLWTSPGAWTSFCPHIPELKEGVVTKGDMVPSDGEEDDEILDSLDVFMYAREGSGFMERPGGLEGAREELVSGSGVWFQILLTSSFFHWFCCWISVSGVTRVEDPQTGFESTEEAEEGVRGVIDPGVTE